MKKYVPLILFSIFIFISCGRGENNSAYTAETADIAVSEPVLYCDSAVLADYATGEIIYEKDSDLLIPPASMTKLVVNYIVFRELEKGNASLDDIVPVDSESDFRNQPPRSSLMFIEEGQKVTLRECLIGLAIPSGNDAAVAVAKYISGDVESFIERMNREMKKLGLEKTQFTDTSGYSENNQTTAGEFLKFAIKYIDSFPGSIADFHSLESFSYPEKNNYGINRSSVHGTIVQYNHNELVGRVEGIDGLKTGYIDESGFNVALTGERDGIRLVGVIMGSRGDTPKEARKSGVFDASVLMTYGFSSFRTVPINPEIPESVQIWNGTERYASIKSPGALIITVPVRKLDNLNYRIEINEPLKAPVTKGDTAGYFNVYSGNEIFKSFPLLISEEIPSGGFLKALIDEPVMFFKYKIFKRSLSES